MAGLPYSTKRKFALRQIQRARRNRIAAANIMSRLAKQEMSLIKKIKSYL